jgi:hypothetical protein
MEGSGRTAVRVTGSAWREAARAVGVARAHSAAGAGRASAAEGSTRAGSVEEANEPEDLEGSLAHLTFLPVVFALEYKKRAQQGSRLVSVAVAEP